MVLSNRGRSRTDSYSVFDSDSDAVALRNKNSLRTSTALHYSAGAEAWENVGALGVGAEPTRVQIGATWRERLVALRLLKALAVRAFATARRRFSKGCGLPTPLPSAAAYWPNNN
jgi:hypothetical protein